MRETFFCFRAGVFGCFFVRFFRAFFLLLLELLSSGTKSSSSEVFSPDMTWEVRQVIPTRVRRGCMLTLTSI